MSIVAKVFRGDLVDMTHLAHIAVSDCAGKILYSLGDPKRVTFVRSSAKPMQVLSAMQSGAVDAYGIEDNELALMCASHNGEDIHSDGVAGILRKAELDKSYLRCGTHPSLNPSIAQKLSKEGVKLDQTRSNCSGKHSAMLLSAKYLNEDLSSYYEPSHPHQKRIVKTIADICDIDEKSIFQAVDGCGVPVHAMPLYKFAQGYARMCKKGMFDAKTEVMISRITDAMTAHPYMVAGEGRVCTDIMRVGGGKVFAKLGADGYYAVGVKNEGIGITCKIEDGKVSIVEGLIIHILKKLGILNSGEFEALEKYHSPKVYNHRGEIVGRCEYEFDLKKHF